MSMEANARELDFIEDLCRLDRDRELSSTANLDVCELVMQSRSLSEPRREWVPAREWSPALPKD